MKRLSFLLFWVVLGGAVLGRPLSAEAATDYYEYKEKTVLAREVVYERSRRMTDAGMLDVHILTAPLNDPYININPVASQKELGLKETAAQLLADARALAGVNGDFFGMAGSHSLSFGPVIDKGRLQSAATQTNATANEFATFFLDNQNNPFMRYMKTEIHFYNNGQENIDISAYNKVSSDLAWPLVMDRQVMNDTAALDKRFDLLQKIVVEGEVITYISNTGETVAIPENGYVVIIPGRMVLSYWGRYKVGDSAKLVITNNLSLDVEKIKMSIGGGGLILSGGQVVRDGGTVASGRQPRTVVGVSKDGKKLILMTIDGRTHSIGATHDETAALLLAYGVYDAMHLDGGGSSTMVVQNPDTTDYEVVNTVSEGAERRIVNALGVFDRSPVGEMTRLGLRLSQDSTFVGAPVTVEAYGMDTYRHILPLEEDVLYDFISPNGALNDAGVWVDATTLVPQQAGAYAVRAYTRDGRLEVWQTLAVENLYALQCDPKTLQLLEGETAELVFSGISATGRQVPAGNAVTVAVVPPELGVVADGVFIPGASGSGYLDVYVHNIHTYVPVTVGAYNRALTAQDQTAALSFAGYPATVAGQAQRVKLGAQTVTRLDYQFVPSAETQAAYVCYDNAAPLFGEPMALRMMVHGDGSGNWLRARVKDAEGQTFAIDFVRNMDFVGWQTVTASLPDTAVAPVTLERVYIASLSSEVEQASSVYYCFLEALYPLPLSAYIPAAPASVDPFYVELSGQPRAGLLALTLNNAAMYAYYETHGASVIALSAGKGGLYATQKEQWQWLARDIASVRSSVVIIQMDADPFAFKQSMEFELLHQMLVSQKNYGRTVFVVWPSKTEPPQVTLKDGVRYISVAAQGGGNSEILFSINGKQIGFDMTP